MKKPKLRASWLIECTLLASAAAAIVYFTSSGCGNNVRCLKENNAWLKARYDPSIYPFAAPPETHKYLPDNSINRIRGEAETFATRHQMRRALEDTVTCAVVGNGITLRESGYGKIIDEHSYVFRMNSARIAGYKKDVGTKTTFNVAIIEPGSHIRDYGSDTYTIVWGGPSAMDLLFKQRYTKVSPESLSHFVMEAPETQKVLVTDKNFIRYIKKNWFTPKQQHFRAESPSTGLVSLIIAVHLCDKISVFGFGPDGRGNLYHYWYRGNFIQKHRPDFHSELLDTMEKQNIITRYHGNAYPSIPEQEHYKFRIGKP